ncbi:MAG: bis(5'-nucleosyl)-tetraphosphatase (symmetrical) YqeK [Anaerocolumna sp.]
MDYDIYTLQKKLSKIMTKKRLYHSLGVQGISLALAIQYGYDIDKANLAGLLHDCAKDMKNEELINECRKYNLPVTDVENRNGFLLHGKLGAYYTEHIYGVKDPEILSAINWHTTGKPDMTLLEKIIFVADYIEPSRSSKRIPELNAIRRLAFTDLEKAVLEILNNTLLYLEKEGQEIDKLTVDAYDYYKRILKF